MPYILRDESHLTPTEVLDGSFLYPKTIKKEEATMSKGNRYATNQGGIIKAPKGVTNPPKSTVVKGSDLRNGKGGKK